MKIIYRLARAADWDGLTIFRNRYSNAPMELDRQHFQQDFEETENKNEGPLFVAEISGQIVGYGRCGYFDPSKGRSIYGLWEEAPRGYYLKGVLTDESVRGLGVGKQLTILRGNWVREKSDRIYCVLQKTNVPSLKMHESLGYKIVKENLNYQANPNDTSGLLLELLL